ncbi:MAG: restriction endonuclease PLD domain-containing protein [Anaerocolumna sp.]
MYFQDLDKVVFFNPTMQDVNRLCILSGYATPNMTSWLIKNISERLLRPTEITLIVGMIPYDGLSISVHEGFKELIKEKLPQNISKLTCSYVYNNAPVHSKIYIWLKDDAPVIAYTGSADFTQNAFSTRKRENILECDPVIAYNYYKNVENDSIYCNHAEIEDHIILYPTHPILDNENNPRDSLSGAEIESVTLSLLAKNGEVGTRSGLNWGQRKGRNKNQAYIPLPIHIAKSGFFPLNKQHFTVVTDDHHQLILRVEQQFDKAITTPLSNAQLGEYFRSRLGLANGKFVTKQDLDNYGRTDVTFYRLDEEQYYLDFSV